MPTFSGTRAVMLMANHGKTAGGRAAPSPKPTTGSTISSAPARYSSTRCGPGSRCKQLPEPVVEKTKRGYRRKQHVLRAQAPPQRHFDALKRMLDRKEPDYAE